MGKKVKAKEPIRVRFKKLQNDSKSIYLDIYKDGMRDYDFLKLYLVPEHTPEDAENRKTFLRFG